MHTPRAPGTSELVEDAAVDPNELVLGALAEPRLLDGVSRQPPKASNTVAITHSSAADELSPLPMGTVPWITPSNPTSVMPSPASALATPRG